MTQTVKPLPTIWEVNEELWSIIQNILDELDPASATGRPRTGQRQASNGIERFRGYAKTRLARCRGMHANTFLFHLKECELRFNHRGQNLYHVLLDLCRHRPLRWS